MMKTKFVFRVIIIHALFSFVISTNTTPIFAQIGKPSKSKPPKVKTTQTKPAKPNEKPSEIISDDDDVLRVDTELVSVPAIVTDVNGKPLLKLSANNFAVFEDNKPQRLENFATSAAPFEVALLLDTSGSTRSEIGLIQRAATSFINALRPGDRVAIVAFKTENVGGERNAVVEVLSYLTDDRDKLKTAISNAKTSSGTPFYEAMAKITDEIFNLPPRTEVRGRRAIVALTDGVDSTSAIEFADARENIKTRELASYFVQLNTERLVEERVLGDCENETGLRFSAAQLRRYRKMLKPRGNKSLPQIANFCDIGQFERLDISRKLYNLARYEMQELAKNTGGKTFPVEDLNEARAALAQVANELGTQYSLGYYSTNPKRDGTFRKIRVELRGLPTGARIQTRDGYTSQK